MRLCVEHCACLNDLEQKYMEIICVTCVQEPTRCNFSYPIPTGKSLSQ